MLSHEETKNLLSLYPTINDCANYSREQSNKILAAIKDVDGLSKSAVVANGSIARNEATKTSDFDYTLFHTDDFDHKEVLDEIQNSLESIGIKPPAQGGAFAQTQDIKDLVQNIGGDGDSNLRFTRRILTILESKAINNPDILRSAQANLIDRYISDSITDHQIALFLLNDLIRYYRTMCVDFEFKTHEDGKSWGERNIKLIFSRKLIYFSGLLIIAETAQKSAAAKKERVIELMQLTPLERLAMLTGVDCKPALSIYNEFLSCIGDENRRVTLSETKRETRKNNLLFRDLKNLGHHFSWELDKLLRRNYSSNHPIYHSIIL